MGNGLLAGRARGEVKTSWPRDGRSGRRRGTGQPAGVSGAPVWGGETAARVLRRQLDHRPRAGIAPSHPPQELRGKGASAWRAATSTDVYCAASAQEGIQARATSPRSSTDAAEHDSRRCARAGRGRKIAFWETGRKASPSCGWPGGRRLLERGRLPRIAMTRHPAHHRAASSRKGPSNRGRVLGVSFAGSRAVDAAQKTWTTARRDRHALIPGVDLDIMNSFFRRRSASWGPC